MLFGIECIFKYIPNAKLQIIFIPVKRNFYARLQRTIQFCKVSVKSKQYTSRIIWNLFSKIFAFMRVKNWRKLWHFWAHSTRRCPQVVWKFLHTPQRCLLYYVKYALIITKWEYLNCVEISRLQYLEKVWYFPCDMNSNRILKSSVENW